MTARKELDPDSILDQKLKEIVKDDPEIRERLTGRESGEEKSKKTGTRDSSRKEDATNVQFV